MEGRSGLRLWTLMGAVAVAGGAACGGGGGGSHTSAKATQTTVREDVASAKGCLHVVVTLGFRQGGSRIDSRDVEMMLGDFSQSRAGGKLPHLVQQLRSAANQGAIDAAVDELYQWCLRYYPSYTVPTTAGGT